MGQVSGITSLVLTTRENLRDSRPVLQVGLRLVYLCPSLQMQRVHWVLSPAATSMWQPMAGYDMGQLSRNILVNGRFPYSKLKIIEI